MPPGPLLVRNVVALLGSARTKEIIVALMVEVIRIVSGCSRWNILTLPLLRWVGARDVVPVLTPTDVLPLPLLKVVLVTTIFFVLGVAYRLLALGDAR